MFGVFRERNRLRHQVEVMQLEMEILKVGHQSAKKVWEDAVRREFLENRQLENRVTELQTELDTLKQTVKSAERDVDHRDKMLGWNFGALIYFMEKRWETKTLLTTLYEKLSIPGKRAAAIEYFRSHGFEVKDD